MLLVTGRFATVELIESVLDNIGVPLRVYEAHGGVCIDTGGLTSGMKFTIVDELNNHNLEVQEQNV